MTKRWRCGRKLPGRLGIVVNITRKPINVICPNYSQKTINSGILHEKNFREVIQGKRNTARYIEILETEWRLSIDEIRRFYAEDKGRVLTAKEISEFDAWYRAKKRGISLDQIQSERQSTLSSFFGEAA